jgi:hypothetical protein
MDSPMMLTAMTARTGRRTTRTEKRQLSVRIARTS